jgi:hypothetical protein
MGGGRYERRVQVSMEQKGVTPDDSRYLEPFYRSAVADDFFLFQQQPNSRLGDTEACPLPGTWGISVLS